MITVVKQMPGNDCFLILAVPPATGVYPYKAFYSSVTLIETHTQVPQQKHAYYFIAMTMI